MSISVTGIAYAISKSAIVGRENYNNYVNSQYYYIPISSVSFADAEKLAKAIGLDFVEYGDMRKSHLGDKYIFWEYVGEILNIVLGRWTFSKQEIHDLLDKLEKIHGSEIFDRSIISKKINKENTPQAMLKKRKIELETIFRDMNLLIESLDDIGVKTHGFTEKSFLADMGNVVKFQQLEDFNIKMIIEKDSSTSDMFMEKIALLDKSYKKRVQLEVEKNLMNNIKNKQITLESRETLDDGTILLTINV